MSEGRGTRADARENRERIVAAARELYAEHGAAPFNAVAQRAGVGNATIYRHFATHQDLREAVLLARVTEVADLLASLAALDDPARELRGYLEWALGTADLALIGLTLLSEACSPAVDEVIDHVLVLFDDLIARAQATGAMRPDADRGTLHTAVAAVIHIGRTAELAENRKREFLEVVLAGLAPRPLDDADANPRLQRNPDRLDDHSRGA